MKHHPDRVASAEKDAAEAKFKEITEAYEVLRDPERRATYDRYGEAGLKRGAGAGAGGFAPFDLSEALNIFMRDFGGLGGFDAFFGGGERARRERHRGQDLKVTLKLSLAEVASGTTKKVKVRTLERCTACGGTGAAPGTKATSCATCAGTGEVRRAGRRSRSPLPMGTRPSISSRARRPAPCIACAARGCRGWEKGVAATCTCGCMSGRPSS